MGSAARALAAFSVAAALGMIAACAGPSAGVQPTARPLIRITPAIPQDVPATGTAFARQIVPTATPPGIYIVKPGDTLSKIADEFQTTIDEIMTLNSLVDPNTIQVGQQLRIPSLPSTDPAEGTPAAEEAPAAPETAASAAPDGTPSP